MTSYSDVPGWRSSDPQYYEIRTTGYVDDGSVVAGLEQVTPATFPQPRRKPYSNNVLLVSTGKEERSGDYHLEFPDLLPPELVLLFFIPGGAPLSKLWGSSYKDVDIFPVGDVRTEHVEALLRYLHNKFKIVYFARSLFSVTLVLELGPDVSLEVQVVLLATSNIRQMLDLSDLDCNCVCWYAGYYWMSPRGRYAAETGTNSLDQNLANNRTPPRALKYCARGFNLRVAGYDSQALVRRNYDWREVNPTSLDTLGLSIYQFIEHKTEELGTKYRTDRGQSIRSRLDVGGTKYNLFNGSARSYAPSTFEGIFVHASPVGLTKEFPDRLQLSYYKNGRVIEEKFNNYKEWAFG